MTTSRLNVRFALGSLLAAIAAGLLVWLVHSWQIRRHAAGQLALAGEAEREGRRDEFLAALDRYLRFDGGNREVRARYALALAEKATSTRDRWSALQVLRQAIAQSPGREDVRLRAVEVALALGEPEQAQKYLEPLLRAEPDRAELRLLAARCEQLDNRPQEALQSLRRAAALAPDRADVAALLAGLYRDRLGQPRLGQATLDRFVKEQPRRAAGYLARARFLLTGGQLAAAAADAAEACRLDPNDADAAATAAEVALLRGRAHEAAQGYRRASGLAPERVELYLGLAEAERKAGRLAAATAALRQARRLAPQRIDVLFGLAEVLLDVGGPAETVEAAGLRTEIAASAPGRSRFLGARIAQAAGRWLEAVAGYSAALEAGDTSPALAGRACYETSRCYAALDAPREEAEALRSAVRLWGDVRPALRLGQRMLESRQFAEGLPLLRWLANRPDAPPRAGVLLARAALEANRLAPAGRRSWGEFDAAVRRTAREPSLAVAVAVLRAERLELDGDPAAARAALEAACTRHPGEPELYLARAALAARSGDTGVERAALTEGDRVLGDRPDWLRRRADRLLGLDGSEVDGERADLEARGRRLSAAERGEFEYHLAEVYRRGGRWADVERLCRNLLPRSGRRVPLRGWLIEALLARGALAEAADEVNRLRADEGEGGLTWRCARAEWLLHQSRAGGRDWAEARRLLGEVRKARPGWSHPIYLLARLDDAEGRTEAALAGYRRVLELGDDRPLARAADLLEARKLYGEALAACERALERGGPDRETLRRAATLAIKAEAPGRARELAVLAVPPGDRSYRNQLWLGEILDAASRPTAAREAFEKAVALAPDAVAAHLALIAHHVRQHNTGEAEAALAHMESAVSSRQRGLAVARAYEVMARPDRAEAAYREILRSRPDDPEVLDRLAALLVRHNRPADAEPVLRRLLDPRLRPEPDEVAGVRRRLALALTSPDWPGDRMGAALALLDENRRQFGDAPEDRRTRALIEGGRADRRAAALRALEGLPAPVLPEEVLRLARLYDAAGESARARGLLLDRIARDPANADWMPLLIDLLLRSGRRAEAAEWIDRLERKAPGSERVKEFRRRWAAGAAGNGKRK